MDDGVVAGLHKLDKVCHMLCGACVKAAAEATATGRREVWEELPGFFELPTWGVEGFAVDLLVLESMIPASNAYIHGMFLELERKNRNARKPRSHWAIDGEMRGNHSSGSRSARTGVQIPIFRLLFIVGRCTG
jgi:hypothetical protein